MLRSKLYSSTLIASCVRRGALASSRSPFATTRTTAKTPLTAGSRFAKFALLGGIQRQSFCTGADSSDATPDVHHLKSLLDRNKTWRDTKPAAYFEGLRAGQAPKFLFIGCSDSRVSESLITGSQGGEIFVHRNIANMVLNSDMSVQAVIQFSVTVLKIPHILVVGHYDCVGVKLAMENGAEGLADHWLKNVRDVYRLHSAELNAIPDKEVRYRRLIELNVLEQAINVYKSPHVKKARQESLATDGAAYPKVHPLVFDCATGLLNPLKADFPSELVNDNFPTDLLKL
eukprot:TRINITY_DN2027_c0_g1_i1.p1 TRINITY_DN2027_c0_g1~~TRINITY_DN2027_c0_g1_i1.p1  ORF type:complete len:287 (+),score=50.98 TRINITY_DN2027_c0_g1_i1:61-921(+)